MGIFINSKIGNLVTYQSKYRVLLLLLLLLLYASYHLGVKKTIRQKALYEQYMEQIQIIEKAPDLVSKYQTELQSIGSKIVGYAGEWNKVDGVFFALLSELALKHEVQITSLEQPYEGSFEQYRLKTYPVSLDASYTKVLALVDDLDQQTLGKPVSLYFYMEKDKNKQRVLKSTLYYKIISRGKK